MAIPLAVASLIPAASSILTNVFDKLDGDEKRQAEILLKQMENTQAQLMAQSDTNKTEAQSSSLFIAGWRPAIGWVCAIALLYEYFIRPLAIWSVAVWFPGGPILPSISGEGMLWELMAGMLGIAGLRTVEKVKRVAK